MKPYLIIKAGGTFPETVSSNGDFEDWTRRGMGLSPDEVVTIAVHRGEQLPAIDSVCTAVITGSHAMVTDGDPWIETTARWVQDAVARQLPILGICFGHQLLAEALGGKADWNPRGREIGTVPVTLTPEGRVDTLLGALPSPFSAHVTHRQSAVQLPPETVLLASSEHDPHQAFRCGSAWGVQFHPEFSDEDTRYYVERLQAELSAEGLDPEALSREIVPTPEATSVLLRFAQLVANSGRQRTEAAL